VLLLLVAAQLVMGGFAGRVVCLGHMDLLANAAHAEPCGHCPPAAPAPAEHPEPHAGDCICVDVSMPVARPAADSPAERVMGEALSPDAGRWVPVAAPVRRGPGPAQLHAPPSRLLLSQRMLI
jgi:hypothetical protein